MEVRLAETFLKVVELGNITKSAESLGYSQTAVTLQIRQLEEELGVKLFDRIGRGIQLTGAGAQFIPYATELLRASKQADAFGLDSESPAGDISIIAGSTLSVAMLPRLVGEFNKKYPRIGFDVQTSDSREAMVDGIRRNSYDFLFDIGVPQEYDGLIKAAQKEEDFVFVCHPKDPLAKKRKVSLEDIFGDKDNYPYIFHGGEEAKYSIGRLLNEHNISVSSRLEYSAPIAVLSVLLEGHARSMLPRIIVQRELDRGELSMLKTTDTVRGFYSQVFYNANKWISPAMNAFIEYVGEYFAK